MENFGTRDSFWKMKLRLRCWVFCGEWSVMGRLLIFIIFLFGW